MTDNFSGKDQREFLRYDYNKPLTYSTVRTEEETSIASKILTAVSKNLSAAGILFTANVGKIPEISSIVALDLDYKTANVCQEIENRALVLKDKLLGRVVRIEDNEDGTCGVGIAFLTKSEKESEDLKDIEKLIS